MEVKHVLLMAVSLVLVSAPQIAAESDGASGAQGPSELPELTPGDIDDDRLDPIGWTVGTPGQAPAPVPVTLEPIDADGDGGSAEPQGHTSHDAECAVSVPPGPAASCRDTWFETGTARPDPHNHFHNLLVSGTSVVAWIDAFDNLVYRYDCFWYAGLDVICFVQSAEAYHAGTQTMVAKGDVRAWANGVDDCQYLYTSCTLHGSIDV